MKHFIKVWEVSKFVVMDIDHCETIMVYLKVIQKNQNNAGTLSLRSARSGTKFEALPFIKYRRPPKHLLMYLFLLNHLI